MEPTTTEAGRARALRSMKRLATGLLLAMAVVFAIAFALQERYPWLEYVRAAAEGGMVGALADWFAVTALFRHPMGLRIPHTAIIPRKKDQIGESLGGFVQENFLDDAVVRSKLAEVRFAAGAGAWLARPEGAERVAREGSVAIRGVLEVLDDEDVLRLLESLARRHMLAPEWSSTLGRMLETVVRDGHHRQLVDLLADRAGDWVERNRATVVSLVSERSPSWLPGVLDQLVGEKLHRELLKFIAAVRTDPGHRLRGSIDSWLAAFAADMQADPSTIAKVEALKHSLLGDPQLQQLAAASWSSVKAAVLEAVEHPESELRRSFVRAVADFGGRLTRDEVLAGKIDAWLAGAAGYLVSTYRGEISALIRDTVARWDGEETSRKIELHVGRDLQFIRINGTVVGSLAGLAIFTVADLILR
ncbi:DUF445 domain-containing protein [Zafaria sp. Z1313]|uniref:DUF445 domain-containing protein n=1 Tax=unclassified Zafaria TaxID=2828765 RepID=UPI002E75A50E|nr:DUF445 family protein [Zafaria sp. J156]MEE1622111.1 DUF445 family protein [Zafaria sp. J156]